MDHGTDRPAGLALARDRRSADTESPRCCACNQPIPRGEGRYNFLTGSYHVRCWWARSSGPAGQRGVPSSSGSAAR
jgi:hypothetical protein